LVYLHFMEKHLDTIHWEYDNCKFIKRGDLKKNIKKKGLGQRESAILTLKFLYDLWRNRLELIWCSNTTFRSQNHQDLCKFPLFYPFSQKRRLGPISYSFYSFSTPGGTFPIHFLISCTFPTKGLDIHKQTHLATKQGPPPFPTGGFNPRDLRALQPQRSLARASFFQRLQLSLNY